MTADKDGDKYPADYTPLSDTCKQTADECERTRGPPLEFSLTSADNAELVHGMPVGLQLVARRLEEEKLLAMTETVLKAIQ